MIKQEIWGKPTRASFIKQSNEMNKTLIFLLATNSKIFDFYSNDRPLFIAAQDTFRLKYW